MERPILGERGLWSRFMERLCRLTATQSVGKTSQVGTTYSVTLPISCYNTVWQPTNDKLNRPRLRGPTLRKNPPHDACVRKMEISHIQLSTNAICHICPMFFVTFCAKTTSTEGFFLHNIRFASWHAGCDELLVDLVLFWTRVHFAEFIGTILSTLAESCHSHYYSTNQSSRIALGQTQLR